MGAPRSFFNGLIDDFGIRHHTDGQKWLKSTGYSLDDAARGLILCLILEDRPRAAVLMGYIEKSLKGSDFYGFASADGKFSVYPCSDDAKGQVVWALGYALFKDFMPAECNKMLDQIQPGLLDDQHIRGYAYALLGAIYFDLGLASKLAKKVMRFMDGATTDWYWPEDTMTYGNGILPYCLLKYSRASGDRAAGQIGQKLLDFVQWASTHERSLGPIGNEGWFSQGQDRAPDYSQQPVDTTYMIMAWLAQSKLSGDKASLDKAKAWMDWFEGRNIAGRKMYEPGSLKAFDGIDRAGVHKHSGAESNICFLLARELEPDNLP